MKNATRVFLGLCFAVLSAASARAQTVSNGSFASGRFEALAGARCRTLQPSGSVGAQKVFLGVPDLGAGGLHRTDMGVAWAASNTVTLIYDAPNVKLRTTVQNTNGTFNLDYPVASPPPTLADRITSFGKTFNVADFNGMEIAIYSRSVTVPPVTIDFVNVQLDGNPLPDFHGTPGGSGDFWRVTSYNFAAGFTLTGTLELGGPIPSSQELNKIELTIGHEAVCGDGSRELGEDCDDGNVANGDCCSSACTFEANGSACASDGNGCTDDVCNGAGSCGHPNNTASCDDGQFCNGADVCSGGTCTHGGDPCTGGAECNNACNETADNCAVSGGTPCSSDGNVCTDDACNGSGSCAHTNNAAPCDDALFCNGADVCGGGVCTHGGDPCAGGAECNNACNESADNCAVSAGTPCTSDGNACTDDACTGAGVCAHPNNTATCSDGNACTTGDICAAGTCVSGTPTVCGACELCDGGSGCTPAIALACEPALESSSVLVVRNSDDNARDKIVFKWKSANSLAPGDFGDPRATTDYQLCIYDDQVTPGAPQTLVYSVAAPAGSAWRKTANDSFILRNPSLAPDGVFGVKLKPGGAGKGKVRFRAKGAALALTPFDAGVFFSQSNDVTVVLVGDDAKCFKSVFSRPWRKNLGSGYRDKD